MLTPQKKHTLWRIPFKRISFSNERSVTRYKRKGNNTMLDSGRNATTLRTHPDEAEPRISPPGKKRWFARHRVALGGILLISVVMNFYELGKNGFGSYYPAAIRSMLDSWHNFFFVSYDPGGFVSIDKPPVGFWLEAASAKIFVFNAVSILLPQALAGVPSALLFFYLGVRPL